MEKENKDAVKSSLMTGVAFAAFVGVLLHLHNSPHTLCGVVFAGWVGLLTGLLTTWTFEEEPEE